MSASMSMDGQTHWDGSCCWRNGGVVSHPRQLGKVEARAAVGWRCWRGGWLLAQGKGSNQAPLYSHFPLLAPSVLLLAVEGRSFAIVLFDPGTTVWPVAPGTFKFCAAPLAGFGMVFASPACSFDAGSSAVCGVAVAELLLPRLPVGLLWANAASGAARITAASTAFVMSLEVPFISSCEDIPQPGTVTLRAYGACPSSNAGREPLLFRTRKDDR